MNENLTKAIMQIIEVCAKRGAFQADEMTVVGNVYNVLKESITPTEAKKEIEETASADDQKQLDLSEPNE